MSCVIDDISKSTKFTFNLFDKISKLSSEKIEFWILPLQSQRVPLLTINFITYLMFAMTILIIILLGTLVYLY